MGVLRRILVALWGFLFLGLAALITVALINHSFAAEMIAFLEQQLILSLKEIFIESQALWIPLLVAFFSLLLAGCLLAVSFQHRRPLRQVMVESRDGSSVQVSLHAIDTVVRRAAALVPGVEGVANHLQMGRSGLEIRLSFSLPAGANVVELGDRLRGEIKTQLENMMGIRPAVIDIMVVNVNENKEEAHLGQLAAQPVAFSASPEESLSTALEAEVVEEAKDGLE
ncbi:MAG: alkaline shock response membrane anchor protein AmaP [Bacillota bacterium]|nr:alkaline shock response membrane anchor protein AmaP [Bacillota bacterium]